MTCLLYANLGRDALFDWDEGIYAELGRQVLAKGELFTTWWNGSLWFEKPPGIAWVTGLGIALAGPTSLGARLLMPLFAVYTLYIVYRLGTKLGSWQHGLLAAGLLTTYGLFLGRTRAVNTDMPLLSGIATTILFLVEKRPPLWPALAVTLSIWFKGPAGLLAALIPLPLFLAQSKPYVLRTISYIFALSLPWHLYAYFRYGSDFLNPYLFEQVLRRATYPIEFHMESRWFYFNYLYENLGLGVVVVASLGAMSLLLNMRPVKSLSHLITHHSYPLTLLWWVIFPLALFTVAKTRLFWYILPVYPALALLIAAALGRFMVDQKSRLAVGIIAVGVTLQGLLVTSRSVELTRVSAPLSDRLTVAMQLAGQTSLLAVLVPETERLAEAILPREARLSSSFRYGGMPSVVFYHQGPVQFFYNVDEFREYWDQTDEPTAMLSRDDLDQISTYKIAVETPTYLGVTKGVYAFR